MMMGQFDGQTVIVTGGTRGIGRAISEAFLAEGASVTAIYAGSAQTAENFMKANAAHATRLRIERLDVADMGAVERFFRDFQSARERLDVLVNNAGIRRDSIAGLMSGEDWSAVIGVNLTGTFNMSKHAVRMMSGKRYGRIISITSPAGVIGIAGQTNYAASKAGQVGFTKALSKEVAGRNITVNLVSPGFIDTDFISDLPDETRKKYESSVPIKRFGRPEEVARAVLFLAARDSSYITGATLEVTGGL